MRLYYAVGIGTESLPCADPYRTDTISESATFRQQAAHMHNRLTELPSTKQRLWIGSLMRSGK